MTIASLISYKTVSLTIGNLLLRDFQSDITYSKPTNSLELRVTTQGNGIVSSNAEGMLREIQVPVVVGSSADQNLKAFIDAGVNIPENANALLNVPLTITATALQNGERGFYVLTTNSFTVKQRTQEKVLSMNGDAGVNMVTFTIGLIVGNIINDMQFIPA